MIASRVSVPVRSAWEVVRLDGSQDGSQKPYVHGVNAGDWIALASAITAVIGAIVALRQARTAKDQARSARDAADAASRQAAAAEEQVCVSRRQLEADMAARNEAQGPTYILEEVVDRMRHQRFVTATLVLLSGPPLSAVTIQLGGADARGLVRSMSSDEGWIQEEIWEDVSPVARRPVVAAMEWNATGPLHLSLELKCVERGGKERTWNRTCTAVAEREPPEPFALR